MYQLKVYVHEVNLSILNPAPLGYAIILMLLAASRRFVKPPTTHNPHPTPTQVQYKYKPSCETTENRSLQKEWSLVQNDTPKHVEGSRTQTDRKTFEKGVLLVKLCLVDWFWYPEVLDPVETLVHLLNTMKEEKGS
jgi:hypothetical protein